MVAIRKIIKKYAKHIELLPPRAGFLALGWCHSPPQLPESPHALQLPTAAARLRLSPQPLPLPLTPARCGSWRATGTLDDATR